MWRKKGTVLKIQDFSVIQILREINFAEPRCYKNAVFCNFRGSEFGQFQRSKSAKIHEIINSEPVNVLQTLISRNI